MKNKDRNNIETAKTKAKKLPRKNSKTYTIKALQQQNPE